MTKGKQEEDFALWASVGIFALGTYLFNTIKLFYSKHPILLIVIVVVIISTIFIAVDIIKERRKRKWLAIEKIEDMHKLHWREFEKFIEFVLQSKGFKTSIGSGTKDGGIDIHASYNGRKYLIQCKKWTNYKVSEPNIREFYGAINDYDNNAKGIYVTTSNLTSDAKDFAKRNEIEIWDELSLEKYIQEYTGKIVVKEDENVDEKSTQTTQICEKCGGKMIERKAKFGANKGNVFLGCENYPKCKNIINI